MIGSNRLIGRGVSSLPRIPWCIQPREWVQALGDVLIEPLRMGIVFNVMAMFHITVLIGVGVLKAMSEVLVVVTLSNTV